MNILPPPAPPPAPRRTAPRLPLFAAAAGRAALLPPHPAVLRPFSRQFAHSLPPCMGADPSRGGMSTKHVQLGRVNADYLLLGAALARLRRGISGLQQQDMSIDDGQTQQIST